MSVYKRGSHWHYRFRVRRVRYRGALSEARTKWEAEQAESKIKQEIFEGRFGLVDLGSEKLVDFINKIFLPWSKANKRSWRHDVFRARTICDYFGSKTFREMSPLLIEKFKRDRRESITRRESVRSPASVNHELTLLSKIFNLAIDYKVTDTNPCTKVKKYKLDNQRYRYLLPEEEPRLMAALSGPRAHLKPLVTVAIGTGMRQGEQLRLTWDRVDFSRRVLILTKTKSGKDREIPMNPEVVKTLFALRSRSKGQEYVFTNERTGTRIKEVKRAFGTALKIAGIKGLVWHDLRATFGTRLGEAGYDAFTIASLMGHSQIQTTARYVRATERNKRAAVEAVMLDSEGGHKLDTTQKRPGALAAVSY
ncbi:MAG: tyrosine-type recombinase/integrase [Pyrinomonadaceae bacterium]